MIVLITLWWSHHNDGRPECPHNWLESRTPTNHFLIPGKITNVPEYHDCQRFLVKNGEGGLKYDSLEAIFVRYELDTVYRTYWQRPDSENRGTFSVAPEINPNGLEVVGQLLSYGDYSPLGIKTGNDCLILRWTTEGRETTYEAWMAAVPTSRRRSRCDFPEPELP